MASIDEARIEVLKSLLTDGTVGYPVKGKIQVIASKNLYKGAEYWKAMLLVKKSYGRTDRHQIGLYCWQLRNEEWKLFSKFNVSRAGYVYDILDALNLLMGGDDAPRRIGGSLPSNIDELNMEIRNLERKKSKVPELSKRVRKLRSMISDPDTTEREVHNFLKREPWMFGPGYSKIVKSEKTMTINSREDFLLRRLDKYYDVLELKSPRSELFVSKRNKKSMSKDLKDAVSQVVGYLSEMRKYYLSIKEQTGMDVFFPKGIIVIGRTREEDREPLRSHKEFFHNLDIWTYDDLLNSAERTIETYRTVRVRR